MEHGCRRCAQVLGATRDVFRASTAFPDGFLTMPFSRRKDVKESLVQPACGTSFRFGVLILVLTALSPPVTFAKLKLPRVPADRNFTQNSSNLLEKDAKRRIGTFQRESFELYATPIMVVTIQSMAKYGAVDYSIER